MRIAVRLDDIAPVMRWENFDRMMEILAGFRAWPLLGVIPDCRDEKLLHMDGAKEQTAEAFGERMQGLRADGARIAMHGAHHVYTTQEGGLFPLGRQSEFAGLPEEEQEALLREGMERMEGLGLATDIFMAPSHSYDDNTLRALGACGFKRVTDGFGSAPYRYRELTFYPIARNKARAARSKRPGTVTLVYHVNTMADADFDAAKALFESAEMISYSALLFEPTVRRPAFGQRIERAEAAAKRFLVEKKNGGRRR